MVKAGKWIKSILNGGKKDKDKVQKEKQKSCKQDSAVNVINEKPATPIVIITPPAPKEKRRWSFRRSSATAPKNSNSIESTPAKPGPPAKVESPARVEVAVRTEEADATKEKARTIIQDAAAIKIQTVFRSYLARKALRALRGLVKLQALVRGRLVRKRATATLRCMEALITAQARARAQRIRSAEQGQLYNNHRQSAYRIDAEEYNFKNSYHEVEKGMMEENIKIVEMDNGETRTNLNTRNYNNNYYNYYQNNERRDDRFTTHYASDNEYTRQDYKRFSPAPSAITDNSPRTCSGHFEDYSFPTAQCGPQCYYTANSKPFAFPHQEYTKSLGYDYPSYMANTKSSRAKARSQSAPKQRLDSVERQLSRRRPSVEGRNNNIPRAVRMQRSSSNVGVPAHNHHYPPWPVKLDKSTVSVIESECGSNCSVLTNTNYYRSDIPYDHQGNRY